MKISCIVRDTDNVGRLFSHNLNSDNLKAICVFPHNTYVYIIRISLNFSYKKISVNTHNIRFYGDLNKTIL